MPDRALTIVAIVRDVGLRSLLAARLTLLQVELFTASRRNWLYRHKLPESATLIVDAADMAAHKDDWAESLWSEHSWRRIVVIATDPPASTPGQDWLIHVERSMAVEALEAHIAEWIDLDSDPCA